MMLHTTARPGSSAEETRSKILAAAKAIYEQNGTRGTTTREVAERAGVNEATLFRHFGNKQALLLAMRQESCGLQVFSNMIAGLSGDVRSDLIAIGETMVTNMRDQRALMCISLAEAARGEVEPPSPEWRGPQQIMAKLSEFFAGHIRRGSVHGDSDLLARFFMGIIFSYVVAEKVWDSHEPRLADIVRIVDTFLNGAK